MTEDRKSETTMNLFPWHLNRLRHIDAVSCVFGWEEEDETLLDLVDEELVKGRWCGSLERDARPMWTLTEKGREMVASISKKSA
jgi:hypothetical protein